MTTRVVGAPDGVAALHAGSLALVMPLAMLSLGGYRLVLPGRTAQ